MKKFPKINIIKSFFDVHKACKDMTFLCIVSFRWYVFWLLVVLVKFQYLPSDCLERLLWGSLTVARGSSPKSLSRRLCMIFLVYSMFHCSIVWLCCSPALCDIHCTFMAQYSLFVLRVPLNNNKPLTKPVTKCVSYSFHSLNAEVALFSSQWTDSSPASWWNCWPPSTCDLC